MPTDDIRHFVCSAIEDMVPDAASMRDAIAKGSTQLADLALESVQILELFELIEDQFDIIIDVQSASNVETIGQLVDLVSNARS